MLAALNDQLQERKLDSQYVTMLFAVWDDQARTLSIANAGSVQPMLVSCEGDRMRARVIEAEGFPLGLFPNAEYEEFTISTRPGDLLVFFSDGIVDAENKSEEMFGTERLSEVLETLAQPDAEAAVVAVLDAVATFQDGRDHFDDETLVVLRVR
jgi:sigma-B regulation protein RsbU (phosphoserine phosphatase)